MARRASVAECLREATQRLQPSSSARLDAEILLSNVLDVARVDLYADPDRALSVREQDAFNIHIETRQGGTPVAYLTGRAEFWSLPFAVTPAVLIPRPETETLVEVALALATRYALPKIHDLGTGSGAVAAALAHELPDAQVSASDCAPDALAVAATNLAALSDARVALFCADWLSALGDACVDMIVSNPPYIGLAEADGLAPDLAHEPTRALFAGEDGLAALEIIAGAAPRCLRAGGTLLVEHGYRQATAVRDAFARHGFAAIESVADLAGHSRVTHGTIA